MSEKVIKATRKVKNKEDIKPLPTPVEIEVELPKYWIKNGIAVAHIDYKGVKMRVAEVRKQQKEIYDGKGGKKPTTFIRGVVCTWLDKDSKFQKGVFHTKELKPWMD